MRLPWRYSSGWACVGKATSWRTCGSREDGQTSTYTLSLRMNGSESADNAPIAPTTVARHEQEVVVLVAYRLTNRQIVQELYLSERTIENHTSKISLNQDPPPRTNSAAWATQQSPITPTPDEED